jgi:ATP-dependent exoDNAse (exonuclease V) beta subunit
MSSAKRPASGQDRGDIKNGAPRPAAAENNSRPDCWPAAEISAQLSTEQRQLLNLDQDTIVRAGAGAGKTTALVGALLNDLLARQIPAAEIAVCTFTRAAAEELRSRIAARLLELDGQQAVDIQQLAIGTIDALALQVIRRRGLQQGQNPLQRPARAGQLLAASQQAVNDTLLEMTAEQLTALNTIGISADSYHTVRRLQTLEDDQLLVGQQLRTTALSVPDPDQALEALNALLAELTHPGQQAKVEQELRAVASGDWRAIGTTAWGVSKKDLLPRREAAQLARDHYRQGLIDAQFAALKEVLILFWERYQQRLAEIKEQRQLASFSDLLQQAAELITDDRPFTRLYLDEAQDTGPRQRQFLQQLVSGPLISVADANQSIYAFRGADLDYFLNSTAGQPELQLTDNYRSRPEVLEAVEALCRPGLGQSMLAMRAAGEQAERRGQAEILISRQEKGVSAAKEAEALLPEAIARARAAGFQWAEITVLLNTNHQIQSAAAVCRQLGIPFRALSSSGWLNSEEVLDLRALLQLLVDPNNDGALIRVLSSPLLAVDDQHIAELNKQRRADDWQAPLFAYRQYLDTEVQQRLDQLLSQTETLPFAERLYRIISARDLDLVLMAADPSGNRWEHVLRFIDLLDQLEHQAQALGGAELLELLEQESEVSEQRSGPKTVGDSDVLTLQTVHNAKGQQFPCVIVAGFSKPSTQSKSLLLDTDGSLGLNIAGAADTQASQLLEQQANKDRAERQRLLYVALTRAEDCLLVLLSGRAVKGDPGATSFAGPLAELMPETLAAQGEINGLAYELLDPKGGQQVELAASAAEQLDDPVAVDYQSPPSVAGPLSASVLADWRRCSLRRWLEGELGLVGGEEVGGPSANGSGSGANDSADDRQSAGGQQQLSGQSSNSFGPALVAGGAREFGLAVHRALELVINQQLGPQEACRQAGVSNSREQEAWELLAVAEQRLAQISGVDDHQGAVPSAEQRFTLALGPYQLNGQVDVLIDSQQRTIIDWKTGDEEEFSEDYSWQRRIYGLAALRQAPGTVEVRTVYLNGHQADEVDRWQPEDLGQLEEQLLAEIEAVLSAEPQPASEQRQGFCRRCPGLNEICPVSQSLVDG